MESLKNLYEELNKLKWIGADDGWDNAISSVQKEIIKRIEESKTSQKFKIMNFNEMSQNGLIWKINKDILHPLGLALAKDSDGYSPGCAIAEEWEYSEETNKINLDRYNKYIATKDNL